MTFVTVGQEFHVKLSRAAGILFHVPNAPVARSGIFERTAKEAASDLLRSRNSLKISVPVPVVLGRLH